MNVPISRCLHRVSCPGQEISHCRDLGMRLQPAAEVTEQIETEGARPRRCSAAPALAARHRKRPQADRGWRAGHAACDPWARRMTRLRRERHSHKLRQRLLNKVPESGPQLRGAPPAPGACLSRLPTPVCAPDPVCDRHTIPAQRAQHRIMPRNDIPARGTCSVTAASSTIHFLQAPGPGCSGRRIRRCCQSAPK